VLGVDVPPDFSLWVWALRQKTYPVAQDIYAQGPSNRMGRTVVMDVQLSGVWAHDLGRLSSVVLI
jgi:hypothetical protein